jgi:hypothetical protein
MVRVGLAFTCPPSFATCEAAAEVETWGASLEAGNVEAPPTGESSLVLFLVMNVISYMGAPPIVISALSVMFAVCVSVVGWGEVGPRVSRYVLLVRGELVKSSLVFVVCCQVWS